MHRYLFNMKCKICGKDLTEAQIKRGQNTCSNRCSAKLKWKDSSFKERVSSSLKKANLNPELNKRRSASIKKAFDKNNSRDKISKASKERWNNPDYKERVSVSINKAYGDTNLREKLSKRIKEGQQKNNAYDKISKASKEHWKDKNFRDKCSKGIKEAYKTKDLLNKITATKRKNNTFNTSKPEQLTKELLQQKFDKVLTQYKDERYPYLCDFYIPQLDLFIECNYHWTHGKEPYDENNVEHQNILKLWKSKNIKFYNNAIHTWTELDPKKLEHLKKNKLNYKIFYSFEEFLKWLDMI